MDRLRRRSSPPTIAFVLDVPPHLMFLAHNPLFRNLRIPGDVSLVAISSATNISRLSRHPPVTSFEADWDWAGCRRSR